MKVNKRNIEQKHTTQTDVMTPEHKKILLIEVINDNKNSTPFENGFDSPFLADKRHVPIAADIVPVVGINVHEHVHTVLVMPRV